MFETGFENEMPAQHFHYGCEPLGTEDTGRSSAPVQPGDSDRRRQTVADQRNLAL